MDYLVDCFAVGDDLHLLAGTNDGNGVLLGVTPEKDKVIREIKGGIQR